MSELIDTTEMYLRTIFELIEEGVPPLRARICERLHQSGPTVSQTVARMERDGLLNVRDDRVIDLTDEGWALAAAVMRKHRLVERLLFDVIGLEWSLLHDEACRWEHVISNAVESKLLAILPTTDRSPYGNPIPGLAELRQERPVERFDVHSSFVGESQPLPALVDGPKPVAVTILHLSEAVQADDAVVKNLAAVKAFPNAKGLASNIGKQYSLNIDGQVLDMDHSVAAGIFVIANS